MTRWLLLLALSAPLAAQSAEERLDDVIQEMGRRLELREVDEVPTWAARTDEPLFRFVQLADIHLTRGRRPILVEALAYVSAELKPDFVLLTGDNTSDYSLEGHRELRAILDEGLSVPWYAIRGDNDARHFAEVFGSTRWSFDWGGVHFVGCGLDRDVEGLGIGTFAPDTWEWLEEDLDRATGRPTIYLQHEPCFPPTFLDAPRLALLLTSRPGVVAVVNGHLHFDLEFRLAKPHLSAIALGPNDRHGLKVYSVYPDGIVARTHWRTEDGFRPVKIFQRIPFPEETRLSGDDPRERTGLRELPARPTDFDETLRSRVDRVRELLRTFDGK